MEAQPDVPVRREPESDVVVVPNKHGVFTFHPMNLRTQMWLGKNVPPDFRANGHVVTGPLATAKLILWMAMEGFVVR